MLLVQGIHLESTLILIFALFLYIYFFRLYDLYSFQVIPVIGEVIAGDWKSYQYLVESIRKFPNQVQSFRNLQPTP